MSEQKVSQWSAIFDTEDGMTQPIRLNFKNPVTAAEARVAAERYLAKNSDWLASVQDVYPTNPEERA